jgi:hypothetical protein
MAAAQHTWTQVTIDSMAPGGIVWGNNQFVAVGGYGLIRTSANAQSHTWVCQTSGVSLLLNAVTYGNGLFVAVGDTGTIITSANAVTWTKRMPGTKMGLHSVTYCNNLFVAVGDTGTILTSPDGTTWTKRTSGTTELLNEIAFGNNVFVVVASNGTILTSPDAITWSKKTLATDGNGFVCVTFGNKKFVAITYDANYYTSSDGNIWQNSGFTGSGPRKEPTGLAYGAGYYILCNVTGDIYTLSDTSVGWLDKLHASSNFYCAAYGNNTFIVSGNGTYISHAVNAIRYTAPKSATNQLLTITSNTAHFTLTHTANTRLTLFDLNGRAVASLISGQKAAGTYNAALPAKLPQGRYVLSLKAGEASCVTHVMITR